MYRDQGLGSFWDPGVKRNAMYRYKTGQKIFLQRTSTIRGTDQSQLPRELLTVDTKFLHDLSVLQSQNSLGIKYVGSCRMFGMQHCRGSSVPYTLNPKP